MSNRLHPNCNLLSCNKQKSVFPHNTCFCTFVLEEKQWSVCVASVCGVSHAVRGGSEWRQQPCEEWRGGRGGQRWHGVRRGALPVRADWKSLAALPSPASGLHAGEFEFISHALTHTQCLAFNGCLMELNSHSSCSAASVSARLRFWIVCMHCVSVCGSVCTCSIKMTSRAPNLSQKYYSFLFAHLSFQQLLFLVCVACSYISLPIPHRKISLLLSFPSRAPLILLLWSVLRLYYTPHAPCQPSPSALLRYVIGWSYL